MKHAFLIMAHNQEELLCLLMKMLDYSDFDLFIHIDKKSSICIDRLTSICKYSTVYITEQISVTWGAYSQIEAELLLLKKARDNCHYDYYHLISGSDLPIMKHDDFNAFFEKNNGYNFINYCSKAFSIDKYEERVKYRHFFKEKFGRSKNFFRYLDSTLYRIQKLLRITNKNISQDNFYIGSQFWDITDEIVKFILNNEVYIHRTYQYGSCCDEAYVQSLVWNSSYRNTLFCNYLDNANEGNMRWIDWRRGKNNGPHYIDVDDLKDIFKSNYLFARKFSENNFELIKKYKDKMCNE